MNLTKRIEPRRISGEGLREYIRTYLLACSLAVILQPLQGPAQQNSAAQKTAERDGQHDFDFEIGTWKTRLSRRLNPLTGSATWVEYEGTTVVRRIWDGRANLVELKPMAQPVTSKVCHCVYTTPNPISGASILPAETAEL